MTFKSFLLLSSTLALAACAVGPDYQKPVVDIPVGYKETRQGNWKPAQPQDAADKGPWWSIYDDPVLDGLEKQITINNQNLKAAEAAYRQARALADEARAGLLPVVDADAGASRGKAGAGKAQNRFNAGLSASWEPDIWGRIRRGMESAEAGAEASAADLANARLSAQAELAVDYFTLRAQDEIKGLLDQTVAGYTESLKITQNQYEAGIVAKTDVMQAETQLKGAQSQAYSVALTRAQFEHAVAVLIGKPPSEFTLQPSPFLTRVPQIPAGIPSALLERRPDIASAERRVASANAEIGVAIAAYFPDLTLSASYGFASAALSTLLTAGSNVWSVGPALALTLFNGGAREAQVEQSRAAYDQTVAEYRQAVLTAFQDVEDQLAAQGLLARQAEAENATVKAAQEAEKLVHNQYRAGIIPYTSVVVAEAASFSAQQAALNIRRDRLTASVNLIKALGGGWDAGQLPAEAEKAMNPPVTSPTNAVPSDTTKQQPEVKERNGDALLGMGVFGL